MHECRDEPAFSISESDAYLAIRHETLASSAVVGEEMYPFAKCSELPGRGGPDGVCVCESKRDENYATTTASLR